MNVQKTVSKTSQAEFPTTMKGVNSPTATTGSKPQEKQKTKRPNYMLRLL